MLGSRRDNLVVTSPNPRSNHALIRRSSLRAVIENRENILSLLQPILRENVLDILEKLSPIFETQYSEFSALAEIDGIERTQYRKNAKPVETAKLLGRVPSSGPTFENHSLFEYQLRRPDFVGKQSTAEIIDNITSIFETGLSLNEHEIQRRLQAHADWPLVPVREPAVIDYLRGLQQTERYRLLFDFSVDHANGLKRHEIADRLIRRVRYWQKMRSFRVCEQIFTLAREIAALPEFKQQRLAKHLRTDDLAVGSSCSDLFTSPIRISISAAVRNMATPVWWPFTEIATQDAVIHSMAAYLVAVAIAGKDRLKADREHVSLIFRMLT